MTITLKEFLDSGAAHDGCSLDSPYVRFDGDIAELDGQFTIEDLELIIKKLKEAA